MKIVPLLLIFCLAEATPKENPGQEEKEEAATPARGVKPPTAHRRQPGNGAEERNVPLLAFHPYLIVVATLL